MLRLTLAQMRRSLGRLSGAAVAIVAGTAFVAATLLAGAVMDRTMVDTVGARYADADLVLDGPLWTADDVDTAREIPGVRAADGLESSMWQVQAGGTTSWEFMLPAASDPALDPFVVVEGALPVAAEEIALPTSVVDRMNLAVGDSVAVTRTVAHGETATDQTETLTVSGVLDDPYGAYSAFGGAAVLPATTFAAWQQDTGYEAAPTEIVVATDGDPEVRAALADTFPSAEVSTVKEHATATVAKMTGQQQVFTAVLLAFAAVALVVAALVIANTFQVLVAQRTRTLALLRCVGADSSLLRRSVLLEAAILGLVASIIGVATGTAIVQVGLWVAGSVDLGVPLPSAVQMSIAAVLVPVAVGLLVTVTAAWAPARAATRVAPLEALRPRTAVTARAGRARVIASVVLVGIGAAALVGAVLAGAAEQVGVGLTLGVLGGMVSFVGLLVGAVVWLPRVAGGFGAALARTGPTARLAVANTLRNPRRTTATSSALLIGVTLVTMMATGAASARVSLDAELDRTYPVDIDVRVDPPTLTAEGDLVPAPDDGLTTADQSAITDLDGVERVVPVSGIGTTATTDDGTPVDLRLLGVDPAEVGAVVRTAEPFAGLVDGELLTTSWMLGGEVRSGDQVTVVGADGPVTLTARIADVPTGWDPVAYVSPATLDTIGEAPLVDLWVRTADGADAPLVVGQVKDIAGDRAQVLSPIAERATMQSTLNAILGTVVGLLAVAVVIAMVGVANTLSLSVLERRRENATLRAIGLSRAQLRGMLAVEGALIALVGAVAGCAIGLLYGWAGALTTLPVIGDVDLVVPWSTIGAVMLAAVAAGLLASVLPARTAARTSPVEALAVD